jgi:hypothetical protein
MHFVQLSDEQLDSLVKALVSGPPAAGISDLAERLADVVELDSDELSSVLEMLASIQGAQAYFDIPADQFVDAVVTAAEGDESLKFPEHRRDKIEGALREVVENSRAIRVASKASELRGETQHRLCSGNCRVITDIRPIFSSDVDDKPDAAFAGG